MAHASKPNYGCNETNPLPEGYHEAVNIKRTVYWTEPGLKVIRFRLLSDPGFPVWDISYCHGVLPNGEHVEVDLPFEAGQLPKRGMRKAIVQAAIKDGVYAKGLGILDNISTLC